MPFSTPHALKDEGAKGVIRPRWRTDCNEKTAVMKISNPCLHAYRSNVVQSAVHISVCLYEVKEMEGMLYLLVRRCYSVEIALCLLRCQRW